MKPKLRMLKEQCQRAFQHTSMIQQREGMCKSPFIKIDTGIRVISIFFIFLNILS